MPDTEPIHPQSDTELARLLHLTGRLSLEQLQPALQRIRSERQRNQQATLGALLVGAGLLGADELEQVARPPAPAAPPPRAAWSPGARIGGYELVEELGRGAMGKVFRAVQTATGREVALKGLLTQDQDLRARFAREAAAQAAVDAHPNVVRVFEAGEASGCAYLAMELVEGGSLEDRLRAQGPLAPRDAARIAEQLARGVQHAHDRGILHRDIKPENAVFDAQGTPKLADFGLARLEQEQSLTLTGQLLGTPSYMAPEQAIGLKQVDARADVYGLGALLYASLTGVPPFQGANVTHVLTQVLSDPIRPPSSHAADLDPALEAICLRALARDPDDRHSTAQAFADALAVWAAELERAPSPTRSVALPLLGLALGGALGFLAGHLSARTPTPTASAPAPSPIPTPDRPSPTPTSTPTPTQPPKPSPTRTSPAPALPAVAKLSRGALVMAPIEEGITQLAWITRATPDRVQLLLGPQVVGPHPIPRAGFSRDGFGPGAQVLRRLGGAWRPGQVLARRGPFALLDLPNQERAWSCVLSLRLRGPGVAPPPAPAPKLHLAPWHKDDDLYPAVVLHDDPNHTRVQVGYFDDDTGWVRRASLRPLPTPGERVTYTDARERNRKAIVRGYPHPWLVELVRTGDRTSVLIGLDRVRRKPADRRD